MQKRVLFAVAVVFSLLFASNNEARVFVDDEEVVFQIKYKGAVSVYLVGDFNGWNPTIDKMLRKGEIFELRLFLLPGRYSYRFIVGGKSIADPDNYFLDEKGNSIFILREVGGKLKIDFEEVRRTVAGERGTINTGLRSFLAYDNQKKAVFWRIALDQSMSSQIKLNAAAGLKAYGDRIKSFQGNLLLLRALGRYSLSDITVSASLRSDILGLGDPLELFSTVAAPFDYPLGVFCNAVSIEHGNLPFGIKGKVFYADRLDDYACGRKVGLQQICCRNSRYSSNLRDSDLIGLRLSAGSKLIKLDYLFRSDKRHIPDGGVIVDSTSGVRYKAYERMVAQGFYVSLFGKGGSILEAEYLGGSRRLATFERSVDGSQSYSEFDAEQKCERGSRFFVSCRLQKGGLLSSIAIKRTLIEEPTWGGKYFKRKAESTSLGINLNYRADPLSIYMEAKLANFSSPEGARSLLLRTSNFWLDGDMVDIGVVPFLSSNEIYRSKIKLSYGSDSTYILPYLEASDISIAWSFTGDFSRRNESSQEVRWSKRFSFHPMVNFLLDVRYISYSLGADSERFLDPYFSYYMRLGSDCWFAVGAGVSPYMFDEILYSYTPLGRERFLIEHGAMDYLSKKGEGGLRDGLISAENAMEEDMSIQFEFGLSF